MERSLWFKSKWKNWSRLGFHSHFLFKLILGEISDEINVITKSKNFCKIKKTINRGISCQKKAKANSCYCFESAYYFKNNFQSEFSRHHRKKKSIDLNCRAGTETNDEWTIEIFKNGISCDKQGKFHHFELHESRDTGPKERDKPDRDLHNSVGLLVWLTTTFWRLDRLRPNDEIAKVEFNFKHNRDQNICTRKLLSELNSLLKTTRC